MRPCTFSLGRRLMVLSGRRTRRTLRDLMVLMSFPFVPLCRWKVQSVWKTAAGWGATMSLLPIGPIVRAGWPPNTRYTERNTWLYLLVERMHVGLSCLVVCFFDWSMQPWRWLEIQSCSRTFTPVHISFNAACNRLNIFFSFPSFQIHFLSLSVSFYMLLITLCAIFAHCQPLSVIHSL